ncbi:cation acetate symporter [Actinomadura sp. WMMB 499]|uniref:sodium:solute symporter family transporter n=1 Tax=Actinomadura sp. WMMB 499 TaxID=1219491 RepID=UPI00159E468D|nr:cation acetate symporter [Actinomadura sp. WMMB 499]
MSATAVAGALVALAAVVAAWLVPRRRPVARPVPGLAAAAREVPPWRNAAAIGGEHLCAAMYLGAAGLVLAHGTDVLWLPVGAAAGCALLAAFAAAPLRRSGAYSVVDFAEWRLGSRGVRHAATGCVCLVGWCYLLPQLHGAGTALHVLTGGPPWAGWTIGVAAASVLVASGGVRSITAFQAVHFWGKLAALTVPVPVLALLWHRAPAAPAPEADPPGHAGTYALVLCVALGTIGLPQVLTHYYTSGGGGAARRTAAYVTVLAGLPSVVAVLYGTLGRAREPGGPVTGAGADAEFLLLPDRTVPGTAGAVLTGLLAAGALAAFVTASCGIAVAVGGTVAQYARRRGAAAFRAAAVVVLAAPLAVMPRIGPHGAAALVTLALAVSACTLCPLLLLGIWWRGLTAPGAIAGLVIGCALAVAAGVPRPAGEDTVPAVAAAPVAAGVMVAVSLLTRRRVPRHAGRAMARLHRPDG